MVYGACDESVVRLDDFRHAAPEEASDAVVTDAQPGGYRLKGLCGSAVYLYGLGIFLGAAGIVFHTLPGSSSVMPICFHRSGKC